MKPRARILLAIVVSACASTPACFLSRNSKAAQIPLPAPTPSTTPARATAVAQPREPGPTPSVIPVAPAPADEPNPTMPASPAATAPTKSGGPTATQRTKPARRKRVATRAATPSQPVVTPAPPATGTAAPPAAVASPTQLGEILTPVQKAELLRSLDQSLMATRQSLSKVKGRPLTSDQAETARLVQSFEEQAESARQTDLSVAVQLAHRAELLARDLANAMR